MRSSRLPSLLFANRVSLFICTLSIIFCFLLPSAMMAQTTGKIAGQIKDKSTGDPMIGTNVYLDGTALGSTTDPDGYFVIINVPPGTYKMVVEQIGYKKVVVSDVVCRVNYTTKINVDMEEEAVKGEEVIVTAERPLIEKDQTGSKAVVTSDEIDLLPVTNFDQVVSLQGGFVSGRFRGGRDNEVLYLIDGVPVNNPSNGGRASTVGIEAIENLEVISGTFNAEYGRVLSGVVNAVTKSGSKEYHGNLETYFGDYYSGEERFYPANDALSLNGIRDIRGSLDGPVPFTNNKLTFLLAGGASNNDGYLYFPELFEPGTLHIPGAAGEPATFIESGSGELRSLNERWDRDLLAKVNLPLFAKTTLSYSFLVNRSQWTGYNGGFRFVPDAIREQNSQALNHIFSFKQVFNPKAFATFKVSYLDEKYEIYLDEDPLSERYLPGIFTQSALTGNNVNVGGTELGDFRRSSQTLTLKTDFTWQANNRHEFKFGAEYAGYSLDEDGKTILFGDSTALAQDITLGLVNPGDWTERPINLYDGTNVGSTFQWFHNENAGDRNPYERTARQAAFYAQDKMEFDKVVVNAGLRFDYFDSQFRVPLDLTDPNGQLRFKPQLDAGSITRDQALEQALTDADPQFQVSPRFGLAYQVTSNGVIHFAYGHFFQIPPLGNLYTNPEFLILPGVVSSQIVGNANLKAQQTVSYELGYRELISENIAGELTLYYRDIYDLLGTEILETRNAQRYARWTNVDYGNVKGAIASLDVRAGKFNATLDYTFQVAEGNASDPAAAFVAAQGDKDPNLEALRLDWDQRHTIAATVNYATKTVSASLIGRFGSGNPFDYSPLPRPGRPILTFTQNNGQQPTNFTLDLNANYNLGLFSNLDARMFIQAFNILDTRNAAFVFADSGSPTSTATLEQNRGNLETATFTTPEELVINATSLTAPRQVRMGIGFRF